MGKAAEQKDSTFSGVGSTLSFPKKSADSQTGPTTSKVETSASCGGGETSSICCNNQNKNSQLLDYEMSL